MIQINLLPWREQAREAKKRRFITEMGIAFLILIFILVCLHLYLGHQASTQQQLIDYVQSQINEEQTALNNMSNQEDEEAAVQSQLREIMNIYNRNNQTISLLNALVKLVPVNVSITKIVRQNNTVILGGVGSTDDDISLLMQAMGKMTYFKQPVLTAVNQEKNSGNRYFEISMEQKE